MNNILVDFGKLPKEVLEEYNIESYASYEAVFDDLFLSDDEFSVRDAVELLKHDTMQEVVEAQPYMYKFDGKYYRWTEDELMGELAKRFPDAVVEENRFVDEYNSPLDMFIEAEVPFRMKELHNLPLTKEIEEDLVWYVQNNNDIMFNYDHFDDCLLNKYAEIVHELTKSYKGVIEFLCASLNADESNDINRKIEEFSPIFESTNYFGIYSYNGDNEYFLVSKESGDYELVLDDGYECIGKNCLTVLQNDQVLDIANKELLGYLVEYSREYIKGLIPERELGGLHVLEMALYPRDIDVIFEDVKRQLESEENCTAYGEPQAFVTLDNGRSIEVTLEKEMLAPEDYFYSARLHCTEKEYENKDYNSTVGIINSIASASANVDEIKDLLIATLKCDEQYPVQEHSKKRSALDDKIAAAEEKRDANNNDMTERSAKDEPEIS